MHKGSTLILKIAAVLFASAVFVLCFFIVKVLLTENVGGYFPILIGMLIAAVPFFIGAYHTLRLLNLIDKNKAFTEVSLKSLNIIKYCGIVISVIYGLGMPYIFIVADRDDAPGVVLLGLIFTFAPMTVAVFAQVLQKVLGDAMKMKTENEMTV